MSLSEGFDNLAAVLLLVAPLGSIVAIVFLSMSGSVFVQRLIRKLQPLITEYSLNLVALGVLVCAQFLSGSSRCPGF